jgi:hypothetical protein
MQWFCLTCEALKCVVCGEPMAPPRSAVHNIGYGLRADLQTTTDEIVAFDQAFDMDGLADLIACGECVGGFALLGPMGWLLDHRAEECAILTRDEALALLDALTPNPAPPGL